METNLINKAFVAGYKAAQSESKRIPLMCKIYQDLINQTKFKMVSALADAWLKGYECQVDVSLGEIFKDDAYFVERSKKAQMEYNVRSGN